MVLSKLSTERIRQGLYWRMKHLEPNLRAARVWRGGRPRVYLHHIFRHPVWDTYYTHPTLPYTPYPFAQLCHYVNMSFPGLKKPHIFEVEHVAALATFAHGRFMMDCFRVREDNATINEKISRDLCRGIITFSAGLVEQAKEFVRPDLWAKLDFVYPAFPSQPDRPRVKQGPFQILIIASRFSDKGVPEALRAFRILRKRYGADLELTLVCQRVPPGYALPDGVRLIDVPRMDPTLKESLYRGADVLLIPCFSETAACFTEAAAFGLPIITTRIHHGDEFVRDGVTGYLVPSPVAYYTPSLGTTWRTWEEFLSHVDRRRAAGDFRQLVDDLVERLEALIQSPSDVRSMGEAGRRLHAELFSTEARNRKLMQIYNAAIDAGAPA